MSLPRYFSGHCKRSIDTQVVRISNLQQTIRRHIPSRTSSITSRSTSSPSRYLLTKLSNTRPFSSTSRQCKLSTEQSRIRHKLGPLTLKAGIVFIITGTGLATYFHYERARVERQKIAQATKGIGKPKVGGPFSLIDQDGRPFTHEDLRDKYALLYFGYTHCPDICPDELDKMSEMIDLVKKACGDILMPVMISCDPARDPPHVIKEYLKEFHPDIIGLTGQYDEIKQTCKVYRVYFSTPPDVKPGQDYMVDHSIYFFLMDPEGDFVEVLGRNFDAKGAAKVVIDHVKDWDGFLDASPRRKGNIATQTSSPKTITA